MRAAVRCLYPVDFAAEAARLRAEYEAKRRARRRQRRDKRRDAATAAAAGAGTVGSSVAAPPSRGGSRNAWGSFVGSVASMTGRRASAVAATGGGSGGDAAAAHWHMARVKIDAAQAMERQRQRVEKIDEAADGIRSIRGMLQAITRAASRVYSRRVPAESPETGGGAATGGVAGGGGGGARSSVEEDWRVRTNPLSVPGEGEEGPGGGDGDGRASTGAEEGVVTAVSFAVPPARSGARWVPHRVGRHRWLGAPAQAAECGRAGCAFVVAM